MKPKNYYEILGVPYDADKATIRKAYRELARIYHPDKTPDQDDTKFKEIAEAYEILENDNNRTNYNRIYNRYFKTNNYNQTNDNIFFLRELIKNPFLLILYIFSLLFLIYIFGSIVYDEFFSSPYNKVTKKHNSLSKSLHKK